MDQLQALCEGILDCNNPINSIYAIISYFQQLLYNKEPVI